jgi:signal transduction histidine kinase
LRPTDRRLEAAAKIPRQPGLCDPGAMTLESRAAPKHRERILIVHSEPAALSGLKERLADRFAILAASSAAEALELLERQPHIAVVIADLEQGKTGGIEFLAEARRRWPDIRRIILTGSADLETAISAVNEGKVFRFLTKPIDAAQLAAALADGVAEYRFATSSRLELHELKVLAASAERARKSFLSMMNHELRTPLNHILGFSALLEQRCRQRGETESLEYLAYIRQSGHALLHHINRIMELARLTAGEAPAQNTSFDLVAMIKEEIRHRRPEAAKRQITMSFAAPPRPYVLEASQHEVAQAIAELLDNAIKFNRPGGHVSIALSWVDEDVAIRIADTGIGMTETEVARVREAFCQKEEGLNRRYEGIGLGLTLAALTAQMNGGSLAIESRKNRGTTVVMRLKQALQPVETARIA